MNEKGILEEAEQITSFDRKSEYGDCRVSLDRIAKLWGTYLGHEVAPNDVCMMMILLKTSRQRVKHKRDNLVDIAGYARLAAIAAGDERSDIPSQ